MNYLVHIGYVVLFQNGALELPPAKKDAAAHHPEDHKMDVAAEMAELHEGAEAQPSAKPAARQNAPQAPSEPTVSAPVQEAVAQPEATEQPAAETSAMPAAEAEQPSAQKSADPGYLLLPFVVSLISAAI